MFKKSLIAVLFSLIMAMVLGTSAFAQTDVSSMEHDTKNEMTPEVAATISDIEKANLKIYSEIAKIQEKTSEMYNKYLEQVAKAENEEQKAALWEEYDAKVNNTILKLDVKTQNITNKEVEKAAKAGVTVEVVWITVQFADREALIDPLVAVGW